MAEKKKKERKSRSRHQAMMNSRTIRDLDPALSGERYVFFSSLLSEPNKSLQAYGQHAQNLMAEVDMALSSPQFVKLESDKTETKMEYIKEYISLLKQMWETAQSNEQQFLQDQLKNIKDKKIKEQLQKKLETAYKSGNFNYLEIIDLFNNVMQDAKTYASALKSQKNNLSIIKENTARLQQEIDKTLDDIEDKYVNNYKAYINKYNRELRTPIEDGRKYERDIARIMTDKINAIIKNLASNSEFLDKIQKKLKKLEITPETIKNIIIDIVVKTVIDNYTEDVETLTNRIINETSEMPGKKILQFLDEENHKAFSGVTLDTIEKQALLTDNSLAELVNLLANSDSDFEELEKLYGGELVSIQTSNGSSSISKLRALLIAYRQAINPDEAANERTIKMRKGAITRFLRRRIKEVAKMNLNGQADFTRQYTQTITEEGKKKWVPESITKYRARLKDELETLNKQKFFKKSKVKQNLAASLYVSNIKTPDMTEIMSHEDTKQRLANVITSNLPGTTIQLKSDIRFSVGLEPIQLDEKINFNSIINKTLKENFSDFLDTYAKEGARATNINAAIKAYIENLRNMKNQIDKEIDRQYKITDPRNAEAKAKAYEALSKTFSSSISVKNYDLYQNTLGFHGGSLGDDGAPEAVIDNINKMYEQGGITPIDKELMIFAVINCCASSVVGTKYYNHITNYLLGGAALVMFDEGFASAEAFIKRVKDELGDNFTGPKTLHLYFLNSVAYVPESMILGIIYNNLIKVYQDINTQIVDASGILNNSKNSVYINNTVSNEDIPPVKEKPLAKDRWNEVSRIAQTEKVQISYMFMAGLLDIINNLPDALIVK